MTAHGDPIVIRVVGVAPVPKGSVRGFVNKATGRAIIAQAGGKTLRSWEREVREAARAAVAGRGAAMPLAERGGFTTWIVFRVARPKSHFNARGELKQSAPADPEVKPDRDKLERAVLDALTGVIWRDDAQAVEGHVIKRYVSTPADVGVTITIKRRPTTVGEALRANQPTEGDEA